MNALWRALLSDRIGVLIRTSELPLLFKFHIKNMSCDRIQTQKILIIAHRLSQYCAIWHGSSQRGQREILLIGLSV